MKYVCEDCGKTHDTAEAAAKCEATHKREAAEAAAKKNAEKAISDAMNVFIAKYKVMPKIDLTEKSRETVLFEIAAELGNIFGEIAEILTEVDE